MTDEEMFALLEYTLINSCDKQLDFTLPSSQPIENTGQYLMFG